MGKKRTELVAYLFCLECAHSHAPDARRERLQRLIKRGVELEEIKETMACMYGDGTEAGRQMLLRDLEALVSKGGR